MSSAISLFGRRFASIPVATTIALTGLAFGGSTLPVQAARETATPR